jgi:hypothetical protein
MLKIPKTPNAAKMQKLSEAADPASDVARRSRRLKICAANGFQRNFLLTRSATVGQKGGPNRSPDGAVHIDTGEIIAYDPDSTQTSPLGTVASSAVCHILSAPGQESASRSLPGGCGGDPKPPVR